jgi:hypothetical protein
LRSSGGKLSLGSNSGLSLVSFPAFTQSGGGFSFSNNVKLTLINLPAYARNLGELRFDANTILTYINVPVLTYIYDQIFICANHANLVYPTGPPNAPSGGLKVQGPKKGTLACYLRSGATACTGTYAICPSP